MIIERIPAVRRCTEDERNGVAETQCDANDQENEGPSARKGGPRSPGEEEGRGARKEPDAAGARLLDEWATALRRSRERVDTFLERYEGR